MILETAASRDCQVRPYFAISISLSSSKILKTSSAVNIRFGLIFLILSHASCLTPLFGSHLAIWTRTFSSLILFTADFLTECAGSFSAIFSKAFSLPILLTATFLTNALSSVLMIPIKTSSSVTFFTAARLTYLSGFLTAICTSSS